MPHPNQFRTIPRPPGKPRYVKPSTVRHLPKTNDLIYGLGGARAYYMDFGYFQEGNDDNKISPAMPWIRDLYDHQADAWNRRNKKERSNDVRRYSSDINLLSGVREAYSLYADLL